MDCTVLSHPRLVDIRQRLFVVLVLLRPVRPHLLEDGAGEGGRRSGHVAEDFVDG